MQVQTPRPLTILGRASSSNVQKPMWLLHELGYPKEFVTRVDIGGRYGKNRESDYLALNPNGVIPTLIDVTPEGEKRVVWESNSIIRYLMNCFASPEQREQLYPSEPFTRSLVERWMDWHLSVLGPPTSLMYRQLIRTEPAKQSTSMIQESQATSQAAFLILNSQLEAQMQKGSKYLVTNQLTLADITIAALAYRWYELDLHHPRAETRALHAWYQTLRARPAFQSQVMIAFE